jgi:hypothetical protein
MAETNYEHYKDEIIKHCIINRQCAFLKKYILNSDSCTEYDCSYCKEKTLSWLEEPYKEPVVEIDWSKVPVDTPIIIKTAVREIKSYFSHIDCYGIAYFDNGKTSWSNDECVYWATECNVRLARPEDIEKYSI